MMTPEAVQERLEEFLEWSRTAVEELGMRQIVSRPDDSVKSHWQSRAIGALDSARSAAGSALNIIEIAYKIVAARPDREAKP